MYYKYFKYFFHKNFENYENIYFITGFHGINAFLSDQNIDQKKSYIITTYFN